MDTLNMVKQCFCGGFYSVSSWLSPLDCDNILVTAPIKVRFILCWDCIWNSKLSQNFIDFTKIDKTICFCIHPHYQTLTL